MLHENFDEWAEYYDLIYSEKDSDDIEFYVNQAMKVDGRVLELGCGTGRIYLKLLEEGVDAIGIDISEKMIDVLRRKGDERKLESNVYVSDMTSFSFDEEFDLIIIPFRTFLHNITVEDQLSTLKNCREHLRDGGKLILNFFVTNPNKTSKDIYSTLSRENVIEKNRDKYELYGKSEFLDEAEEIVKSSNVLYKNGKEVWKSEFKLKLVQKREFELLLRLVGFDNWKVYGGFNSEELENFDQEMVWIVEK